MTIIYNEADADINVLRGKTIGLISEDAPRRTMIAAALRAHGLTVLASGEDDASDGTPPDIAAVVRRADVLWLALPDETLAPQYIAHISPQLRRGQTLIFASAYTVAFGLIEPPPFIDVALVAPRHILTAQRQAATRSHVAVWQDASRTTWATTLAFAAASGALAGGATEITAEQEAELSLFIAQAILPAFYHLVTRAAELLLDQGYPAEAVLTDLYLSGRFSDYLEQAARRGLLTALQDSPLTAQYSTLSRLDRFDDLKLGRLLEVTLDEIRSGRFVREWTDEYTDGLPRLNKLQRHQAGRPMWDLEQQTIEIFDETQGQL